MPKKFGEESFSVSRFSVIEKIMHKKGMPRFSFEKLLSHGTGKPRRGTFLCFRGFSVSRKFMDRRGGGRNYDLLSEIFCHTVPKSSLGNIFGFQKNSVIESFHALEGRTAILRLKFCVAH